MALKVKKLKLPFTTADYIEYFLPDDDDPAGGLIAQLKSTKETWLQLRLDEYLQFLGMASKQPLEQRSKTMRDFGEAIFLQFEAIWPSLFRFIPGNEEAQRVFAYRVQYAGDRLDHVNPFALLHRFIDLVERLFDNHVVGIFDVTIWHLVDEFYTEVTEKLIDGTSFAPTPDALDEIFSDMLVPPADFVYASVAVKKKAAAPAKTPLEDIASTWQKFVNNRRQVEIEIKNALTELDQITGVAKFLMQWTRVANACFQLEKFCLVLEANGGFINALAADKIDGYTDATSPTFFLPMPKAKVLLPPGGGGGPPPPPPSGGGGPPPPPGKGPKVATAAGSLSGGLQGKKKNPTSGTSNRVKEFRLKRQQKRSSSADTAPSSGTGPGPAKKDTVKIGQVVPASKLLEIVRAVYDTHVGRVLLWGAVFCRLLVSSYMGVCLASAISPAVNEGGTAQEALEASGYMHGFLETSPITAEQKDAIPSNASWDRADIAAQSNAIKARKRQRTKYNAKRRLGYETQLMVIDYAEAAEAIRVHDGALMERYGPDLMAILKHDVVDAPYWLIEKPIPDKAEHLIGLWATSSAVPPPSLFAPTSDEEMLKRFEDEVKQLGRFPEAVVQATAKDEMARYKALQKSFDFSAEADILRAFQRPSSDTKIAVIGADGKGTTSQALHDLPSPLARLHRWAFDLSRRYTCCMPPSFDQKSWLAYVTSVPTVEWNAEVSSFMEGALSKRATDGDKTFLQRDAVAGIHVGNALKAYLLAHPPAELPGGGGGGDGAAGKGGGAESSSSSSTSSAAASSASSSSSKHGSTIEKTDTDGKTPDDATKKDKGKGKEPETKKRTSGSGAGSGIGGLSDALATSLAAMLADDANATAVRDFEKALSDEGIRFAELEEDVRQKIRTAMDVRLQEVEGLMTKVTALLDDEATQALVAKDPVTRLPDLQLPPEPLAYFNQRADWLTEAFLLTGGAKDKLTQLENTLIAAYAKYRSFLETDCKTMVVPPSSIEAILRFVFKLRTLVATESFWEKLFADQPLLPFTLDQTRDYFETKFADPSALNAALMHLLTASSSPSPPSVHPIYDSVATFLHEALIDQAAMQIAGVGKQTLVQKALGKYPHHVPKAISIPDPTLLPLDWATEAERIRTVIADTLDDIAGLILTPADTQFFNLLMTTADAIGRSVAVVAKPSTSSTATASSSSASSATVVPPVALAPVQANLSLGYVRPYDEPANWDALRPVPRDTSGSDMRDYCLPPSQSNTPAVLAELGRQAANKARFMFFREHRVWELMEEQQQQ